MKISVEKATKDHAEAIAGVGRRSFTDAFEHLFINKKELEEYLDYTYEPSKIERSISKPNNQLFIACVADAIIGFGKMKKLSKHKALTEEKQSELQKIYVLEEYHSSGAGQLLMKNIIETAKEINTNVLWLDVHIDNAKAIRFYQKNNFTKVGNHSFVIGTQTFYYDVMALIF